MYDIRWTDLREIGKFRVVLRTDRSGGRDDCLVGVLGGLQNVNVLHTCRTNGSTLGMLVMKSVMRSGIGALSVLFAGWMVCGEFWEVSVRAAEPVTLETVVNPGPNRADEPLAEAFSLERAHEFLDAAALSWQKERKCFTCHTNYAYLHARPALPSLTSSPTPTPQETVRAFAEQLVLDRWVQQGPRWDAEVVATAAALAFQDARTTGRLHPATRQALDRMWTVQQEDGGWNWLKCEWPPMESDDHYGVTLAALAVGVAPDDYADSPAAREGLAGIRRYLSHNPPPTLHHRGMLLWAARYLPDLLSDDEKHATMEELKGLQRPDGGWGLAALGDWKRADGTEQDRDSTDGYGTGFVVYVLLQGGLTADDPDIQRGIGWLETNQRASGRWYTRSLYKDNHHFITHAGTALAVMAIEAYRAKEEALE
jgi:squalene-hopene/tetraprenyl-beta-curcumene cyclase